MEFGKTRVIFVTGGVFSSLGKGLTLANIGRILKELGFRVSVLKLDPYLNIDSGSLSPTQHGEVYVTADGHETDLDLGHYERFLNYELTKYSCITAGTIYQRLLGKRNDSSFTGDTIQVFPHLIDEIHAAIFDLISKDNNPHFLLVEIGGTVGDIEHLPFIEAACFFRHKYGKENVLYIHISPIFYQESAKEYKTKPTQHSIRQLFSHNIFPDILILRSSKPLPPFIKDKITKATQIKTEDIFSCIDHSNIYLIAESLYEEKIHLKILEKLHVPIPQGNIDNWKKTTSNILAEKSHKIRVAIIGKYSSNDAYMSINESLKLASYNLLTDLEIDYLDVEKIDNLNMLKTYDAICVPHGFGKRGTEEKIKVINYCRVNNIPFLGICFGMQLACIEFARSKLNTQQINSTEIEPNTPNPLFIQFENGKMKLGNRSIKIRPNTKAHQIFNRDLITVRHRHRYHLNPQFNELFKNAPMIISGVTNDNHETAEIIELKDHPFFIASQFHPEFETKFTNISPLFTEFLRAGMKKK